MRATLFAACLLLPVVGCAGLSNRPAAAPAVVDKGLGFLPSQGPPRAGCGLYLYATGKGRLLVLVADSSTGQARIMVDGAVVTLPFLEFEGVPRTGFSPKMRYGTDMMRVDLDLDIDGRTDMRDGAAIERGSMRYERAGEDAIALPIQGLVTCVR